MRITYNAPFVLTLTFLTVFVMFFDQFSGETIIHSYFTLHPYFDPYDPLSYERLMFYALGHAGWAHLLSNFTYILLIGPILEEKYGTRNLFVMSLITVIVTGLLNLLLFPNYLLGASGIVFMMILLVSFTNVKKGYIPLTFILILMMFLGTEVLEAFQENNISEFSHIVGGIFGSIFGFARNK